MGRGLRTGGLAALALAAIFPAGPARASSLTFLPCAAASTMRCTTLAVPLDRSGRVPGTITLAIERHAAGPQQSANAVIALAGGPGQAALPFASYFERGLAPALASRDLLVFDQRGTGASDPLSCAALEEPLRRGEHPLERCAADIGPARGAFTSQESVEDIEAIRQAAGYRKLVLFGISYGTKVALDYAERYPQNVEALVLDSVVPPAGDEPFRVVSFQAIGPALSELCGKGACAGISADPLGDLARLDARLRTRTLRGTVFDGSGHRHRTALSEVGMFELLIAGDLNPALRALLPAAVHSALHGDPSPLLRLELLAAGLVPSTPGGPRVEPSSQFDEALFAATYCEETPFPWNRSASATTRMQEARAALAADPPGVFFPFDSLTALRASTVEECSRWPDASPPPPAQAPLPTVPTLVLSGAEDLRTPTADARAVAALIPGAQLLVVPYTGHSVLGTDLSGCASRALAEFFAGTSVGACTPTPNTFSPTPVSPISVAALKAPRGLHGRAGRTLVAVLDSLLDLDRQVIGATLEAAQELPAGSAFGGLRGGYARLSSTTLVLHRYSFVPGVTLSGRLRIAGGHLQPGVVRVAGYAAASGHVRVGSPLQRVSGRLGGHRFSLVVARARLSAAGAGTPWPGAARLTSAERLATRLR